MCLRYEKPLRRQTCPQPSQKEHGNLPKSMAGTGRNHGWNLRRAPGLRQISRDARDTRKGPTATISSRSLCLKQQRISCEKGHLAGVNLHPAHSISVHICIIALAIARRSAVVAGEVAGASTHLPSENVMEHLAITPWRRGCISFDVAMRFGNPNTWLQTTANRAASVRNNGLCRVDVQILHSPLDTEINEDFTVGYVGFFAAGRLPAVKRLCTLSTLVMSCVYSIVRGGKCHDEISVWKVNDNYGKFASLWNARLCRCTPAGGKIVSCRQICPPQTKAASETRLRETHSRSTFGLQTFAQLV